MELNKDNSRFIMGYDLIDSRMLYRVDVMCVKKGYGGLSKRTTQLSVNFDYPRWKSKPSRRWMLKSIKMVEGVLDEYLKKHRWVMVNDSKLEVPGGMINCWDTI